MEPSQLLKGVLEGCVLEIIRREETYGYEIVRTLRAFGFENVVEGTIYPMLLRCEKNGYLKSRRVESEIGPKRKVFSLTQEGEQYLDAFLDQWTRLRDNVDRLTDRSSI